MLKVFLVEDETVIREGLRDRIPWEQYGYRFVGEAADGEVALPLIRKTRPDVLITDIKMPFMDGLSLSRIVREEFPKTKILIISGYDDFEYAREAISIGVDQYILKPVTRMSLRKVLQELKEKIEAEQEQEDFQSKLANEMHEYEQFSIRHFFEQVLEGELCVTEIYDEAAKWSLDLSASCYNLLFLYVQQEKENGSEREMNTFVHLQEEILQYFLRFPQYILFRWNVNCYGVLVKSDAEEMEDYTQRAIAQIQMNCESQNANADWYVVVGTPVERLSMLKECYDRVNHYGAYRFLYPQMHVLSEETLKSYLPAQDDTRIAEVDATKMSPEIISEFLAKGSSKEVYNFVESYLQSISEVIHSVIFRDYVVLNIRFTAIAFMERNGVTKEEFLAHIGKYGTNVHVQQDEVFEYFLSILQTAIDLRDEQNTNLSSKTLKKALAYIDEHYTSENLSLGTVACEVQVGANYLSSVFSQNMQKTFTEYISEKRMEKAKKLLKSTELPTSEIAAQVGYKDPHYFSFVFKKTQGCSPREYRSGI